MNTKVLSQSLLDAKIIENKITAIMCEKNLGGDQHSFFINASHLRHNHVSANVTPLMAFELAKHWEIITKTFMFTTFQSLSKLSEFLENSNNPAEQYFVAFQTGLAVIADDINNNHPAFSKVAPKGAFGIHYKWWHNDIVLPLANKLNIEAEVKIPLTANVEALITGMRLLANKPMGFSVQLRIVEDIALHIAIAFRSIFNNISNDGANKFFSRDDLAWIISHIQAEVSHRNQVADTEKGMTYIISNYQEQQEFLEMVEWYANLWEKALNDFNLVFQNKK